MVVCLHDAVYDEANMVSMLDGHVPAIGAVAVRSWKQAAAFKQRATIKKQGTGADIWEAGAPLVDDDAA